MAKIRKIEYFKRETFERMSESGAESETDGIQINLERRIEI
jgi:hypothetical protein